MTIWACLWLPFHYSQSRALSGSASLPSYGPRKKRDLDSQLSLSPCRSLTQKRYLHASAKLRKYE